MSMTLAFFALIWAVLVGGFAGLLGSFVSARFEKAWGIPRDHWLPWFVSLTGFAAYGWISLHLPSPPLEGRIVEIDRASGWTNAAVVLIGHVVSYFVVKARFVNPTRETDI